MSSDLDPFAFEINLKGRVVYRITDDLVELGVAIDGFPLDPRKIFHHVPRGLFANDEEMNAWIAFSAELFTKSLLAQLGNESWFYISEIASIALNNLKVYPVNFEQLVKQRMEWTTKFLSHRLNVPAPNQRSPWVESELIKAVTYALAAVPAGKRITLAAVADELRAVHPDKAPASGEALRKLLERLEINWRELKKAESKRRLALRKRKTGELNV